MVISLLLVRILACHALHIQMLIIEMVFVLLQGVGFQVTQQACHLEFIGGFFYQSCEMAVIIMVF